jgi:hypothetical protein
VAVLAAALGLVTVVVADLVAVAVAVTSVRRRPDLITFSPPAVGFGRRKR